MASIREVPSKARRFERIGAHTHIKGLGLDENMKAVKIKDGMVGQEKAREAAGLVVQMIKEGKLSGKRPSEAHGNRGPKQPKVFCSASKPSSPER